MHRKAILFLAAVLAARDVSASTSGDVVVLESFMVAASRNDPWRYAATPGFEILSHCPDDFTERYVQAIRRSVAAEYAILPADFWGRLASPMKIILYNTDPQAGAGNSSDVNLVAGPMDETNWGAISVRRSRRAMATPS